MRKAILIFLFSVICVTDFCQTNVYHPFPDSNAVLNVGDTLPISCLNPGGVFVFHIDSVLVANAYNKRFLLTNGWSYNYPALIEGLGGTYGAFGNFEDPTNEWDEILWCVQINNQPVMRHH